MPAQRKVLIIRFSSIGDVVQTLSVASRVKELGAEVHWVTRADLAAIPQANPHVDQVWSLDRKEGAPGLLRLMWKLQRENFTHVYDAHNNLRSFLISAFLRWPFAPFAWSNEVLFLRKPKYRWKRFLLFRFRRNTFRTPFSGQRDLLEPLEEWGLSESLPPPPQLVIDETASRKVKEWLKHHLFPLNFIVLCPSASYELKRWPLGYWQKLINANPDRNFLVLGGPGDGFINELLEERKGQVLRSVGTLSLAESAAAIALAQAVVSNDTGLLHIAEQLGKKSIALMGPAPFGFPSRPSTLILETELACRPCSKHGQGPCVNKIHQRCLREITPEIVSDHLNRMILT